MRDAEAAFLEDTMSEYEIKTLTGKTMDEVLKHFKRLLPADAYDKVPGGANLTDISPAYLLESLTDAFGLCGFGWSVEYDPANIKLEAISKKRQSGGTYEVYSATISKLELRFRYTLAGNMCISDPIVSAGGSENDKPGDALKGAITNALSKCGASLLWQIEVYKGHVDHTNATKLNAEKAQAKPQAAPAPQQAAKPAAAPAKPAAKPASNAPAAVKAAVEQPEPAMDDTQIFNPGDLVITFGQHNGKKLSECPRSWVEWLANKSKPAASGTAVAAAQDAAKLYLVRHPVAS
jgi:hypothetical protein